MLSMSEKKMEKKRTTIWIHLMLELRESNVIFNLLFPELVTGPQTFSIIFCYVYSVI